MSGSSALASAATESLRPTLRAALIGSGIQKTRTPRLHMAEGKAQGFDYHYDIMDIDVLGVGVEALENLISDAEARGLIGLNITHPCKQAVIPLLQDLSTEARILGAVNTVTLRDGHRVGHNTDWSGYFAGFRRGFADVARDRVVLLGAGGAGLAVAYALTRLGVGKVYVHDVDPARVEMLISRLAPHAGQTQLLAGENLATELSQADGLIHCTPTGMAAHPGLPLDEALIGSHLWVSEIVYFPLETQLLATARQKGCRVLDGGGMAVFQAVDAFRLFTGVEPDAARMIETFASM